MAKDPAFLFYPGDWLGGTMTFTREQKGAYIDLLMAQFNNGHMTIHEIRNVLGENDFKNMWENILIRKFKKDSSGKYYNEKLEYEIVRRQNYSQSRRKNRINGSSHDR